MRHEWKRSIPWEPPGCERCSRVSSFSARAADASANELPAERVLRTPEDAAACFRLLPALLLPAALVCRPAAPSPRPGTRVGAAPGLGGHGRDVAKAGQRPRALHGHSGRCSVLGRSAGLGSDGVRWGLGAPCRCSGYPGELRWGRGGSLLSSVLNRPSQSPTDPPGMPAEAWHRWHRQGARSLWVSPELSPGSSPCPDQLDSAHTCTQVPSQHIPVCRCLLGDTLGSCCHPTAGPTLS